jgi:hypothetical protein
LGRSLQLTSDQNTKIRFENDQGGYRIASSVDGTATGDGGDIIIIDDPISAKDALSPRSGRVPTNGSTTRCRPASTIRRPAPTSS